MENKLVIFDMGGVVCRNFDVVPIMADKLGISEADFYRLAGEDNLRRLYCGDISIDDFWQEFSRAYGENITEDLWAKFYCPKLKKDTIRFLKIVKKSHRAVVGTNTIHSHYEINKAKGYYRPFHEVYASNKMGLAKPDPDFYMKIIDSEDHMVSEALFIDDKRQNVRAAQKMGIEAILFQGNETLKEVSELL